MKRNSTGKTLRFLAVLTALFCVTLAGNGLAEEIEVTERKPEADNEYTYIAGSGRTTIKYIYDDDTLTNSAQTELTLSQTPYATITASGHIPGSNVFWCLDSTGLLSVSGTGAMPNFQEETAPWYGSKYYITSVVIENGITSIGAYAFSSHDHILGVQLPDSLTTIGVRAFWGCSALPSITIPRSVNLVDTDSLYYCSALKDIWYGGMQEEWDVALKSDIGNATVHFMMSSATEQICGDNLTWLYNETTHILTISGTGAMYDYDYENPAPWESFKEDITAVVIDSDATAIGAYAFGLCDSLATATIPDSVTAIGSDAFPSQTTIITPCTADTAVTWAQGTGHTLIVVHSWNLPSYTWAENNSTCKATRACANADHSETETVISVKTITATCDVDGTATYTATFESEAFSAQTKTVNVQALGHAWGEAIYTWAENDSAVTASRTCSNCSHAETETASVTSEVTTPVSCTGKGVRTYTAAFVSAGFLTQTKTEEIDAAGHVSGTAVQENRVASTCMATGSYDNVIKCVVCGQDISREKVTIPLAAHTPEYHAAVQHSCFEDGNHKYWQCTVCSKCFEDEATHNEITQEQTVDPARHNRLDYRAAYASTCTWRGNVEYWICTACGDCFSDEAGTTLIGNIEDTKLPPLNHPSTEIRTGDRTEPTCIAPGGYYEYVYCNTCETNIESSWIVLEPLGHSYSKPVYVWSEDNEECTGSRVCTRENCNEGDIQGTLNITRQQTKDPTCTEKGETTYTAVFDIPIIGDTIFEMQTKVVANIDALGHDLVQHTAQTPTCTEAGWDAYDTCSRCGYTSFVERPAIAHTPEEAVRENEILATCDSAGSYDAVIYCSVCSAEISRERKTTDMLGHDWENVVHFWNEDRSKVTAARTCRRNNTHTESETVDPECEITSPTEDQSGIAQYRAVFSNEVFNVEEEAVIPPLCQMKVLRLPVNLTAIEEQAFAGIDCDAVIVPDTCNRIETKAFENCKNLKYIKVSTNTFIEHGAFEGCEGVIVDKPEE